MSDVTSPTRRTKGSGTSKAAQKRARQAALAEAEAAAAPPPVPVASAPPSVTETAEERAALARQIEAAEFELYTCHQGEFCAGDDPEPDDRDWYYNPLSDAPDLAKVTVSLYERLTVDVPWYQMRVRRAAKTRAAEEAVRLVERLAHERETEREHAREEARRVQQLLTNDPEVVIETLDHVLLDCDAVVERVDDGIALVRLLVAPVESLIGDQEPGMTAAGRSTLKRRTASRRNLLYAAVLSSRTIRIAKISFAAVPKLRGVHVCIDQLSEHDTHTIYEGLIRRSSRLLWNTDSADPEDLARSLSAAAEVEINLRPRTGELRPLDAADEPRLAPVPAPVPAPAPVRSPSIASARPKRPAASKPRTAKKPPAPAAAAPPAATALPAAPPAPAAPAPAPARKTTKPTRAPRAQTAAEARRTPAQQAPKRTSGATAPGPDQRRCAAHPDQRGRTGRPGERRDRADRPDERFRAGRPPGQPQGGRGQAGDGPQAGGPAHRDGAHHRRRPRHRPARDRPAGRGAGGHRAARPDQGPAAPGALRPHPGRPGADLRP